MSHNARSRQRLATFRLSRLLGMNTNSAKAFANYESEASIQPSEIVNLTQVYDRGLTPFGDVREMTTALPDDVIGNDRTGLISFEDAQGEYGLFDGGTLNGTLYGQMASPYPPGGVMTHIPMVGAYRSKDQFLALDIDNNVIEPANYNIASLQEDDPAPAILDSELSGSEAILWDGNRIIVGGANARIRYSDDNGETWTEVQVGTGGGAMIQIRALGFSGSLYMAVGNSGYFWATDDVTDAGAWVQYRAVDDIGANAHGAVDNPDFKDVYFNGAIWAMVANSNYIATAPPTFDPALISFTQQNPNNADDFSGLAYDSSTNRWTVVVNSAYSGVNHSTFRTSANNFTSPPPNIGVGGSNSGFYNAAASNNAGIVLAGGERDADAMLLRSTDSGLTWAWHGDAFLDGRIGWKVYGMGYRADVWIVVGSGNRIYRSDDQGVTFVRVPLETPGDTRWTDVAFDADGDVYVSAAAGLVVKLFLAPALKQGRYEVVAIPYIRTKAGKLVIDIRKDTFNVISETATITFTAPATAIENIFVDLYVRFAERLGEEDGFVLDDLSQRSYLFLTTLEPGDEFLLKEMPTVTVGVLGLNGPIGIAGFGNPWSVLHNGRIYSTLSDDITDYKFLEENIKLEEFYNPFFIAFTEIGYVNLFTANNTIPIGINQSEAIQGIAQIPQGLVVLADNEAFVVSGDDSTDNLRITTHPETIGLDPGATPAAISGAVFTVWKGQIWAITEQRPASVSRVVYDPQNPVRQIVAYPDKRSLLARHENGLVLQYELDNGFWFRPPLSTGIDAIFQALSEAILKVGNAAHKYDYPAYIDRPNTTPEISFKHFDFANTMRQDKIFMIRIQFQNWAIDNFDTIRPILHYRVEGMPAEATVTAEVRRYNEEIGIFVFPLPTRIRGREWTFRFVFHDMPMGAIINPDWEFKVVFGRYPIVLES